MFKKGLSGQRERCWHQKAIAVHHEPKPMGSVFVEEVGPSSKKQKCILDTIRASKRHD